MEKQREQQIENAGGTSPEVAKLEESAEGLEPPTPAQSRRVVLKLDLVLIPFASLLYLASFLDRGNIGNARLQGLEATALGGSDSNYSLALACFYITYIVCSIPGTLLSKAVLPSHAMSAGAFIWGVASVSQAGAKSPAGEYVCRLFIGIGEAMFGQAIALYLSFWYTRSEIGKRIGLFVCCGALSGAFGGLIAYGVSSIVHSSVAPWRILFIMEGAPSILLAICVFLFMPTRPQSTGYLTEDERHIVLARLEAESLNEGHHGIDWNGFRRAITDWKVYSHALMYSCLNLGLGSVGGFLPTIINGLGYTATDAQLYTVPPYAVALVVMLLLASFSDHFQTRGAPVASVFIVGIVGWGLLIGVSPIHASQNALHARYAGCIFVVVAGYSAIALIIAWTANNNANETQRATALGMLNTVGQCLSVLAAYSFPSSEGPIYKRGIVINLAFQGLGLCLASGMSIYYRRENKRRDRVEGGAPVMGEVLNVVVEMDRARGELKGSKLEGES